MCGADPQADGAGADHPGLPEAGSDDRRRDALGDGVVSVPGRRPVAGVTDTVDWVQPRVPRDITIFVITETRA